MKRLVLILLSSLFLMGAVPLKNMFWSNEYLIAQWNKYNKIQIMTSGTKRRHKVIKTLNIYIAKGAPQYGGYRGLTDVMEAMAREARKLGADAVIKCEFTEEPLSLASWGAVMGTGVAIRYR